MYPRAVPRRLHAHTPIDCEPGKITVHRRAGVCWRYAAVHRRVPTCAGATPLCALHSLDLLPPFLRTHAQTLVKNSKWLT